MTKRNEIHISGNDLSKVRVEAGRVHADITPDYCLVNLKHYTIRIDPEDYLDLRDVMEIARELKTQGEE